LHSITPRKSSQFINTIQTVFPGYIFIIFDRVETEWHKVINTYVVSHLVTFSYLLKSIPTTFIDSLIMRYYLSGKLLPIKN